MAYVYILPKCIASKMVENIFPELTKKNGKKIYFISDVYWNLRKFQCYSCDQLNLIEIIYLIWLAAKIKTKW